MSLSYYCYASLSSMFNYCNIRSSNISQRPSAWVNSWSHPWMMTSSWAMDSFITSPLCSQTSNSVVSSNFNYNTTIYICRSKVTLSTLSFEVHITAANFLTLAQASTSLGYPTQVRIYRPAQSLWPGFDVVSATPPSPSGPKSFVWKAVDSWILTHWQKWVCVVL